MPDIHYHGLVCLDGPDATGKTTLANAMAEYTKGEVIHLTWSPELEQVMNNYRMSAMEYAAALAHDRVVVLERPWASNYAYSSVYRDGAVNECIFNWKRTAELHQVLNIFAMPSDVNLWISNYDRMAQTRDELHGSNLDKMQRVYHHFQDLAHGRINGLNPEGEFEIYDYQRYINGVDTFIENCVLPHLSIKLTRNETHEER